MSVKIKVCGMKYQQNIEDVAALHPDYMGFIFYPRSKRFVGVDFELQHIANLPVSIKKTAVFVNATEEEILEFSELYKIKVLQLHGEETPELCASLKNKNLVIIKAFGVDSDFDFSSLEAYLGKVDFFLFDTKTKEYGGSGKTYDWEILNNYTYETPFFLSGGLDEENLKKVKEIKHPQLYAVDLNSKFEVEPAVKNIAMLQNAVKNIRS